MEAGWVFCRILSLHMLELFYKIGDFNYRLDALVEDIKRNRISIYDVPVAQITAQFNAIYEEAREKFEIGDLTFFYKNAAELLLIKIIRLLPVKAADYDDGEEGLLQEQVINALEKLRFSQYADLLLAYRESHRVEISRHNPEKQFRIPYAAYDVGEILKGVRLNDLSIAYVGLMRKYDLLAQDSNGQIPSFSLNERFDESMKRAKRALIGELLQKKSKILFSELIGESESINRLLEHMTMSFLAVVDAVCEGECYIWQERLYDDFLLIAIKRDFSSLDPISTDREYDRWVEDARGEGDGYSLTADEGGLEGAADAH